MRPLGARDRWSRPQILRALRQATLKTGRPPTSKEWQKGGRRTRPCAAVVKREFGSWNGALAAAGLEPRRAGAQRQTVCQRGHRLDDPSNVLVDPRSGNRCCRACRRTAQREAWRRRAAARRKAAEAAKREAERREAAARREAQRRRRAAQVCKRGHSLRDPANVVYDGRGDRSCRACKRRRDREYAKRRRRRLKAAA
jgi:Homing endonuclease associated repeat